MAPTPSPRPHPFGSDLDEWVRHVVDIHFHPVHGSPYWIERAKELGIDARRDVRCYDDLALFGFFPIDALRTRNVLDFLPASMAKDRGRLRVHETGGTTGSPSRIALRDFSEPVNLFVNWYLDEVVGFPRKGNWLFIGPTGPHGVAESIDQMARHARRDLLSSSTSTRASSSCCISSRTCGPSGSTWSTSAPGVRASSRLSRSTCSASTPILLQALAPELKDREYRFYGMMYGGTQLSPGPLPPAENRVLPGRRAHRGVREHVDGWRGARPAAAGRNRRSSTIRSSRWSSSTSSTRSTPNAGSAWEKPGESVTGSVRGAIPAASAGARPGRTLARAPGAGLGGRGERGRSLRRCRGRDRRSLLTVFIPALVGRGRDGYRSIERKA